MDSDFKKKIGTCIEILDKLADSDNFDFTQIEKQYKDSMRLISNDLVEVIYRLGNIYKICENIECEIKEKDMRREFDEKINKNNRGLLISGFTFDASQILKELRPELYNLEFKRFRETDYKQD